jgi:hypothetical protein
MNSKVRVQGEINLHKPRNEWLMQVEVKMFHKQAMNKSNSKDTI